MLFKNNLRIILDITAEYSTSVIHKDKKKKIEYSAFVNRLRHNQKVYFEARDTGFQERIFKAVAKSPSIS